MKSLFVALAIVFGFCLQSAAAQTAPPQPAKEKEKAEMAEWVKAELSKISKELNLTTEQNAQIKTLLTEENAKLEPMRKEYEQKTQGIREEYRGKMRAVLSPEQQKQFDMMKQMRTESRKPMEPVAVPK